MTPVIGGQVSLTDGTVSIPQTQKETEQTILTANNPVQSSIPTQANSTTSETASNQPASSTFVTALNDLQVQLEDFKLQQIPVYEFSLTGDLTLNGTIDQPSNIIPDGTLELTSANVDVLSSSFSLVRNRENTIVFTPEAGIFNPTLDIQIQTEISEFDEGVQADNLRVAESGANEINDPLSQGSDNGDIIKVFLNIDGEAIDILPNLATASPSCNVRADNAALTEHSKYYSEAELNQLTDCFNQASLRAGDRQIINSPAVELTSIPSRSQGEIVSLLGNEFLSFAEQFNNSSQSNIFDVGVSRFVIEPIQKSIFNRVDEFVVDAGKEIGLDYLRVYPYLEGIYEINKDSSVRSTYNYILNEIRIEYDLDF